MTKKFKDVVVKAGEYQDRNIGETKARWKNVGTLMENDDDGSLFILLERTFNPAGVNSTRDTILLSCFDPKDRDGNSTGGGSQQRQPSENPGAGVDDEVPF